MTDLFKAQPLEEPNPNNIELDENVVAGKAAGFQSEYYSYRDLITYSDS